MCEEARCLIIGYMDALEEFDRLHLMFLAACRGSDSQAVEGYRGLLQDAKLLVQTARGKFQEHQRAHNCSEVIHLEDGFASGSGM